MMTCNRLRACCLYVARPWRSSGRVPRKQVAVRGAYFCNEGSDAFRLCTRNRQSARQDGAVARPALDRFTRCPLLPRRGPARSRLRHYRAGARRGGPGGRLPPGYGGRPGTDRQIDAGRGIGTSAGRRQRALSRRLAAPDGRSISDVHRERPRAEWRRSGVDSPAGRCRPRTGTHDWAAHHRLAARPT